MRRSDVATSSLGVHRSFAAWLVRAAGPPATMVDVARTRVVAHRGASADAPEHTLAAYERALTDGADGLECDVRLTADGHLVCVHDRRLERTSNGYGAVSAQVLDDLAALDFGLPPSPPSPPSPPRPLLRLGARHPLGAVAGTRPAALATSRRHHAAHRAEPYRPADPARTGILTFDRLLAMVADAGRRVELAVETKHPTRYASLVERRLVETLHRYGFAHPPLGDTSPVRVMSFSWLSLRRMRVLAPSVPTVLLMDRVPLRMRDGSLPFGVAAAGLGIAVVREEPALVRRFHRRGYQVHVWTVNEPADIDLCTGLDVEVIITDRPRLVLDRTRR